ncbi:MAG: Nif3-like dinuclear metal center hexameric protein [Oligoflexia bacterium]|nr:Nif3-like dinuclear metal center hexameric protein [Oligoflexia bacterium]
MISELERRAPSGTAENWDNVGLLVGDPGWKTSGAVVTVDLTEESLEEAKRRGFRLIINHHPCIFPKSKGLSRVVAGGGSKSSLVFEAIRSGIAVAAYHTNFDRCALEVIEKISSGLKITPRGRLFDHARGTLCKLVVFVPESHADAVRAAVTGAGAGHIGDYDSCSFETEGTGHFRGSPRSSPFLGKPGQAESVPEVRIETVLPRGLESSVVRAMREAHPYEEIAYDIYPVDQAPAAIGLARGVGYGFWGDFDRPKPFSEVVKGVKKLFEASGFLLTDPPPKTVRRLAFAAGKGASFVESAAASGCDLLITGEAGYHDALSVSKYRQARAVPMAVMEVGHRESERFFSVVVGDWIKEAGLKAVPLETRTQRIYRF